jgi:acetylornithine deacetylase
MPPEISEILSRLIEFPTVSLQSNLKLLDFVESLLVPAGIAVRRFAHADGTRANLWATVGPEIDGGIVLSGHSDVVPVTGQKWSSNPFILREDEGRWYGRGAVDMKGFVAVAIHTMLVAVGRDLKRPLHLALSYDEELGCLGVRGMIESLANEPLRPAFCLVGEPTGMHIATGHKGKTALRACCHGHAGHSALAPEALNALHLGAAFLNMLQARQTELASGGAQDADYAIPYTTIHAGIMRGGEALNIVPATCEIDFEVRHIAADDPKAIIATLIADAKAIVAPHLSRFPKAAIEVETISGYPGLNTPADDPTVAFLSSLLGTGNMAQGHKPDEYIELSQIEACSRLHLRLLDYLQYA